MIHAVSRQLQSNSSGNHVNLKKLRLAGLCIWFAIVILQWLWWLPTQDSVATILLLAGGIIGAYTFLRQELLAAYPISTVILIGYTSYYFLFPPLATFFEGRPLTNNLDHPALVFIHAFVFLLFLICAHFIYRRFHPLQIFRWFVSRNLYQRLGFFTPPSNLQLFLMGTIGLAGMWNQYFLAGGYQSELLGVTNKLIQGLYPLAYLPYIILLIRTFGQEKSRSTKWLTILFNYSILLILVAMARNSRTAFLIGFASIGLVVLYAIAVGLIRIEKNTYRKIALGIIIFILVYGPVVDLGQSMIIVRDNRTEMSAKELVFETIKTFQNKELLQSNLISSNESRPVWDEWYVSNIFMARLCNLKYADNSIDLALSMGSTNQAYIRGIEMQRILSIFPRPLINALHLKADKNYVGAASSGDFMLYAVTGDSYTLGGFRTGSIFGNGYALFGWWYPLFFTLVLLFIFPLADSLTSRSLSYIHNSANLGWHPLLSPMVIINFFSWFFFLTSAATGAESLSSLFGYLLRGWIQVLFVYAIPYWTTYLLLKMVAPKHVT